MPVLYLPYRRSLLSPILPISCLSFK
uniref:Uncharacterized protein n=1 Tax=Anguilla anguilla TaxID=7936 RepID=A0A0E9W5M8_ANGAN